MDYVLWVVTAGAGAWLLLLFATLCLDTLRYALLYADVQRHLHDVQIISLVCRYDILRHRLSCRDLARIVAQEERREQRQVRADGWRGGFHCTSERKTRAIRPGPYAEARPCRLGCRVFE